MIYAILIWTLLGSIGTNVLWAVQHQTKGLSSYYTFSEYLVGTICGVLLGPLCFVVVGQIYARKLK